jgi:micrococcal nuclease
VIGLAAAAFAAALVRGLARAGYRGVRPLSGTVRRVVDGDTLDLTNAARIRLLDIDTPEYGGPDADPDAALRATVALRALVGEGAGGRRVTLEYGPDVKDRHGRFLAYCIVPGTTVPGEPERAEVFVNAELVRRGLARVYRRGRRGPRFDEILAAEREARASLRGLWAEGE